MKKNYYIILFFFLQNYLFAQFNTIMKKEVVFMKIVEKDTIVKKKEKQAEVKFEIIKDTILKINDKNPFQKETITNKPTKKLFSFPLDDMLITSSFGMRKHPVSGKMKMHNGVDLKADYEFVYAVLDGIASEVSYDEKGGGIYIKIKHNFNYETSYLHLSKVFILKNDKVKAGDIIGVSGNTGNSTGPHLHFGVTKKEIYIDPIKWLTKINKINNQNLTNYGTGTITNR